MSSILEALVLLQMFLFFQAVHSAFPETQLPHHPPRWERPSDTIARCVEIYDDPRRGNNWSCNLCVTHVGQIARYPAVVEHLKSE